MELESVACIFLSLELEINVGEMLYLILVEVVRQIDQEDSEEEDNCQQTVNENNYQWQIEVLYKEEGPDKPPEFRGPLQFQPLLRPGIH